MNPIWLEFMKFEKRNKKMSINKHLVRSLRTGTNWQLHAIRTELNFIFLWQEFVLNQNLFVLNMSNLFFGIRFYGAPRAFNHYTLSYLLLSFVILKCYFFKTGTTLSVFNVASSPPLPPQKALLGNIKDLRLSRYLLLLGGRGFGETLWTQYFLIKIFGNINVHFFVLYLIDCKYC